VTEGKLFYCGCICYMLLYCAVLNTFSVCGKVSMYKSVVVITVSEVGSWTKKCLCNSIRISELFT
jgi:hypothetical protein